MDTETQQLTRVELHGWLGEEFGKVFNLAVSSVREAILALKVNFPNFAEKVKEDNYHIYVGGRNIGLEEVTDPSGTQEIHIVPVVAGSKGIGKIIIGIALIGLALYLPIAAPALFGAEGAAAFVVTGVQSLGFSLLFGGIAEMLFSPPKPESTEPVDSRPSSLFQGAINTVSAGGPVPVGYGRLIVGSTVIGASITTQDVL